MLWSTRKTATLNKDFDSKIRSPGRDVWWESLAFRREPTERGVRRACDSVRSGGRYHLSVIFTIWRLQQQFLW